MVKAAPRFRQPLEYPPRPTAKGASKSTAARHQTASCSIRRCGLWIAQATPQSTSLQPEM